MTVVAPADLPTLRSIVQYMDRVATAVRSQSGPLSALPDLAADLQKAAAGRAVVTADLGTRPRGACDAYWDAAAEGHRAIHALFQALDHMGMAAERARAITQNTIGEPTASDAAWAATNSPDAATGPSREATQKVRDAYWEVARHPNDWVSLTDLRERMQGYDRAAVDAALTRMEISGAAVLVPEDDQQRLTARDRADAVRVGGTDLHRIAMESR